MVQIGSDSPVTTRNITGESAGLFLRNDGGDGMPTGNSGVASAIAVCTSTAALSRLRSRLNCRVMVVIPRPFDEIMESRPAMVVNCRSSGVATADAMVSGLAPGRLAETVRVGKLTLGRSATGRLRYAITPNSAMPAINRLVAIGLSIKTPEIFKM